MGARRHLGEYMSNLLPTRKWAYSQNAKIERNYKSNQVQI